MMAETYVLFVTSHFPIRTITTSTRSFISEGPNEQDNAAGCHIQRAEERHPEDCNPAGYSGEARKHGRLRNLAARLKAPIEPDAWQAETIAHNWSRIVTWIRYSSRSAMKATEKMVDLQRRYQQAFKTTTVCWRSCPKPERERSSQLPLWTYCSWSPRSSDKGTELEMAARDYHHLASETLSKLILFLILSVDGLSTNLQWLMHVSNGFLPLDLIWGICGNPDMKSWEVGREKREDMMWSFYLLAKIRSVLRGEKSDIR